MNKLFVLLSLGVLILVVVFGFFIFYKPQQGVQSQNNVQIMSQTIKDLSSKVIPSVTAYGVVTKIDGRNISLSQEGDTILIGIKGDAKIYSLIKPGTIPNNASVGQSVAVDFKDIKIGDRLGVTIKVLSDGHMEGASVIILPSAK